MVQRGYRTISLELRDESVPVRTSPRTADALEKIMEDMTLYEGVKLTQVLEAVYRQGKKDGARDVFDELERVKKAIPHQGPGRPRIRRR